MKFSVKFKIKFWDTLSGYLSDILHCTTDENAIKQSGFENASLYFRDGYSQLILGLCQTEEYVCLFLREQNSVRIEFQAKKELSFVVFIRLFNDFFEEMKSNLKLSNSKLIIKNPKIEYFDKRTDPLYLNKPTLSKELEMNLKQMGAIYTTIISSLIAYLIVGAKEGFDNPNGIMQSIAAALFIAICEIVIVSISTFFRLKKIDMNKYQIDY